MWWAVHDDVVVAGGGSGWTNPDAGLLVDAAVIVGENNAVPSGTPLKGTALPNSYWPTTYTAVAHTDFRDPTPDGGDPRPSSTNFHLQGIGATSPGSPTGYAFPNPLWPPAYLPPLRTLEKVGTARPWGAYNFPTAGPDVGAYSYPQRSRIASGAEYACGLYSDGSLACWGRNSHGQLGDGTVIGHNSPECSILSSVIEVAASVGGSHTCALLADATVKCWGDNAYGQVGDGTTSSKLSPITISGLSNVVSIAAGATHTCAVLASGGVSCWGRNNAGQIGDGTTTNRLSPTPISGLGNAVSITAGASHTCAVLANGGVSCWGRNAYGQLGDGTTTDHPSPLTISGVSGAVSLAAGDSHTCARLASSGVAQCWGLNSASQLGDGTTTDHHAPTSVTVSTSAAITAIAAGGYHTCAVLSDGTAKCWGENDFGECGTTNTTNQMSPASVYGASSMTGVACGVEFTCAILGADFQCWGSNSYDQLGNEDAEHLSQYSPVTTISCE
jgi:alpha-tubulin suppressor-like RCC1 family protein